MVTVLWKNSIISKVYRYNVFKLQYNLQSLWLQFYGRTVTFPKLISKVYGYSFIEQQYNLQSLSLQFYQVTV
jgi:hypothetical protein